MKTSMVSTRDAMNVWEDVIIDDNVARHPNRQAPYVHSMLSLRTCLSSVVMLKMMSKSTYTCLMQRH